MSAKRDPKGEGITVIIKKEEVIEGGHHGGAWKVAYADFVTAMMAFFLLMWLLNATSEAQRHGIADYFSPINPLAAGQSGNGQPFGGKTPFENGAMVSDRGAVQVNETHPTSRQTETDTDTNQPPAPQAGGAGDRDGSGLRDDSASGTAERGQASRGTASAGQMSPGASPSGQAHAGEAASGLARTGPQPAGSQQAGLAPSGQAQPGQSQSGNSQAGPSPPPMTAQQEQAAFQSAAQQIRDAVRNDPALASLGRQLAIDETPEGLRIQLLDEDKQSMFAFGSSTPNDRARLLLLKVAPVLSHLSEDIAVTGHTDAAPFRGPDRSNWELSSERANATRRVLVDGGLFDLRFRSVAGDADRDPLLPGDPLNAANRRIAIVVLRSVPLQATPPQAPGGQAAPVQAPAPKGPPAAQKLL